MSRLSGKNKAYQFPWKEQAVRTKLK